MPTKTKKKITTITQAIDTGWDISFENTAKYVNHGWIVRVTYTASLNPDSDSGTEIESDWDGFETAKEAVKDLLKAINSIK